MNNPGTNRMDIGEEEEEEMQIYANADHINSPGVRTETKNTGRDQTPQHTGSDCVKTVSRAAQVCLVLLCFFLLTAVIVLSVLIYTNYTDYTQEREELQTRNLQLTKKIDEISKSWDLKKNELLKMDGWIYYHSNFYISSSEKKSWNESRRDCKERGADLIIINNGEEQEFVNNRFVNDFFWIGLTDSDEEDKWKWVDGNKLYYESWRPGEPNGFAKENCVLSEVTWIDHECQKQNRWICERNYSM